MSQTQPVAGATASAPMTIIEKLRAYGPAAFTAVEHAAVRLVGDAANAETSLKAVEQSSPMFQLAWSAGKASAIAHGVPVGAIGDAFDAVMAKAQEFVAGLTQPPAGPAKVAA